MADFCPTCGASWRCDHQGGGETGEWRIANGPTLRAAIAAEPADDTGSLPTGMHYWQQIRADIGVDQRYARVPEAMPGRTHPPTVWPAPGWREQAPAITYRELVVRLEADLKSARQTLQRFAQLFDPFDGREDPAITQARRRHAFDWKRPRGDGCSAAVAEDTIAILPERRPRSRSPPYRATFVRLWRMESVLGC